MPTFKKTRQQCYNKVINTVMVNKKGNVNRRAVSSLLRDTQTRVLTPPQPLHSCLLLHQENTSLLPPCARLQVNLDVWI